MSWVHLYKTLRAWLAAGLCSWHHIASFNTKSQTHGHTDFMACHTFCFSDDEADEGREQRAMRFYDKSGNLADILTQHPIFQPIRSQHLMIQLANCCPWDLEISRISCQMLSSASITKALVQPSSKLVHKAKPWDFRSHRFDFGR